MQLSRFKLVPDSTNKVLNSLLFNVFLPAMLLPLMINYVNVHMLGWPLLLCGIWHVGSEVAGILIGSLLVRLMHIKDPATATSFVATTTFSNCGNLPLALSVTISSLKPVSEIPGAREALMAYTSIFVLMCSVMFWRWVVPSCLFAASHRSLIL